MSDIVENKTKNQSVALAHDFASVLHIIEQNRTQAVLAINHASVLAAWQVGAFVSDRIKNAAWGSKVVQQLAEYIHTQNPTLKGWSRRTIYKMVQFYETYTAAGFVDLIEQLKLNKQIVPTLSAQIEGSEIVPFKTAQNGHNIIVSFEMAQIPSLLMKTGWTNHQIILNRCESPTMVSKYEEQLKVGSVLQRSLEEFVGFIGEK